MCVCVYVYVRVFIWRNEERKFWGGEEEEIDRHTLQLEHLHVRWGLGLFECVCVLN